MQISSINPGIYTYISKYNNKNNLVSQELSEQKFPHSYNDYNLMFRARTPENFYAQEFNINHMPASMKEYLYSDYETKKNLPPEQMMQEVFQYLNYADNFDEVKQIFPNEPLFKNLHSNIKNSRNSLLAEIKMVKGLSSEPLLKDGCDDLGMYLLRKIYLEGKTVKEINKDFYEKDLNESYKGLLTKRIDYDTTSAYGIKYPDHAFWKSFIATRNEYKKFFVTLPKKNSVTKEVLLKQGFLSVTNNDNRKEYTSEKKYERKYQIQKHKKTQLTNEIKNSKNSLEIIERKIRKKFSNSDIESPFVLKYLSPIMTIAADRVHLSEEMKNFAQKIKIEPSNDEKFFARFWKEHPLVLEDYAKTIPETIDMFQEYYQAGGLIPINKSFEVIKSDSIDKKVIDYVPELFLELLDYAKNIDILRAQKNELHRIRQEELEKIFDIPVEEIKTPENVDSKEVIFSQEELKKIVKKAALENNAEIYELFDKDGNKMIFTGDLNEAFGIALLPMLGSAKFYPSFFQKKYIDFFLAHPTIDEKFKLSVVAQDKGLSSSELYSLEELIKITNEINFPKELYDFPIISSCVIKDYIALKDPVLAKEFISNDMFSNLDRYCIVEPNNEPLLLSNIIIRDKAKIDNMVTDYTAPLSRSEITKIKLALINSILHFKPEEYEKGDFNILFGALSIGIRNNAESRQKFSLFLDDLLDTKDKINNYNYARSILNKKLPKEIIDERCMDILYNSLNNTIYTEKAKKIIDVIGERYILFSLDAFSESMASNLIKHLSRKVPNLLKM